MARNWFSLVLLTIFLLLLPTTLRGQEQAYDTPPGSVPDTNQVETNASRPTDQIIVKFIDLPGAASRPGPDQDQLLERLGTAAGVPFRFHRPMSGGAVVLKLPSPLPLTELDAVSAVISALPEVDYAEADRIFQLVGRPMSPVQTSGVVPNDTRFTDQWHYGYTAGTAEGINLPAAWGISTGSSSTVVAVIDTGILDHADLSGRVLPGYDFIDNPFIANDGDGRDSNPADPGDWVAASECGFSHPPSNSSWHGTHVAGTIGAATNNAFGVAGVNWHAKILPIRVLGKCGGALSDIIDGSRWAAGLSVPGVPNNDRPADVLNLSLGGQGSCETSMQNAINEIVAAGTTIVIASGNSNDDVKNYSPASCDNIIAVAANDRTGDKAWYSNFGAGIDVTAPGGETNTIASNGVLSTLNTGNQGPSADTFAYYQGTSMAAPHVAGVASLILGLKPAYTPDQVLARLKATVRTFPEGSSCIGICGAGIVDAYQAINDLVFFDHKSLLPLIVLGGEPTHPEVRFKTTDYQVGEGDGQALIEVSLNPPASEQVSVDYATTAGTATPGEDYQETSGTLQFQTGQSAQSFTVNIIDDDKFEPVETVNLTLSNPDQAALGAPSQAILNITNNDVSDSPVVNGDFEAGSFGWTEYSANNWDLILQTDAFPEGVVPHSGDWAVWLGGDYDEISFVAQDVTVPGDAPYLTYWHWIGSSDECGFDFAGVLIGETVVDVYALCEDNSTGGWVKHAVDLSAYASQSVSMQIRVETDSVLNSNLFVDDVSFQASADVANSRTENRKIPGATTSRPELIGRGGEWTGGEWILKKATDERRQ